MDKTTLTEEKISSEVNINEELVTLIRGFFSTPVISALGMTGALQAMIKKPHFTLADFPDIPNKQLLRFSFDYLTRVGVLESASRNEPYRVTELGRQIFQRVNSFYAPHSYGDYMVHFRDELMSRQEYRKYSVDRYENIIGSGRTHERYFPPAVSFLRRKVRFDVMLDLGCGDGRFLEFVLKGVPQVKVVGIDLSEVSVKTTRKNLQGKFKDREIETFSGDAGDIQKWSETVKRHVGNKRIAISKWFLLHEISGRDPANVISFLKEVHRLFPGAPIVICELVRQSADLLTQHRKHLLMPEYLLFHDISLQGVLSWQEYRRVLSSIPYDLVMERVFDELQNSEGSKEPATFVWCLTPKIA